MTARGVSGRAHPGLADQRITVVTAGHLATCPRMLKAADSLAAAGCRVHLVSTRFADWATEADLDIVRRRAGSGNCWRWSVVDFRRGRSLWLRAALRRRLARLTAAALTAAGRRCPPWLAARAIHPVAPELARLAAAAPIASRGDGPEEALPQLIYGGTVGGLAPAARAARRLGVQFALDLEDFHPAEQAGDGPHLDDSLADRLLGRLLPGAAFASAGSAAIADAYRERYDQPAAEPARIFPLHNVFALPAEAPAADRLADAVGPLRLYWFSQTIGPGRGLEQAVAAAGLQGSSLHLTLRGRPADGYRETFEALARTAAPRLTIDWRPPAPPDEMIELCREHHVGLSLELADTVNRTLCLANKPLTYILAGLPVALTDMPGQRQLAGSLGEGALLVPSGDADALADGLARWARDRRALAAAGEAAWRAASERWHWHHPREEGALLAAVAGALGGPTG